MKTHFSPPGKGNIIKNSAGSTPRLVFLFKNRSSLSLPVFLFWRIIQGFHVPIDPVPGSLRDFWARTGNANPDATIYSPVMSTFGEKKTKNSRSRRKSEDKPREVRLKEGYTLAGEKWEEAEWKGDGVEPERFSGEAAANRADLERLRAAWKSALRNPFRDLLKGLTLFQCLGSLSLCVCVRACVCVSVTRVCLCVHGRDKGGAERKSRPRFWFYLKAETVSCVARPGGDTVIFPP